MMLPGKAGHAYELTDTLAQIDREHVITTTRTVRRMLDTVPPSLWDSTETRILDPCSKAGEFLKACAERLWTGLEAALPDPDERRAHILVNALYGIATSRLTGKLTRRTLYCDERADGPWTVARQTCAANSLRLFPGNSNGNVVDGPGGHRYNAKGCCADCGVQRTDGETLATNPAHGFLHGAGRRDMHFNLIIGNPPYHRNDGGHGASATPLYHKFIEQAIKMNPDHLVMIIPARWYTGGKGLNGFRERMMADRHMAELHDVEDSTICFPDNEISGGVCYFRRSLEHDGPCEVVHVNGSVPVREASPRLLDSGHGFVVRRERDVDILRRVQAAQEPTLDGKVSSRKPFGLDTNQRGRAKGDLELRYRGGSSRWDRSSVSKGRDAIDKWKVIVSRASGAAMTFDVNGQRSVLSVLEVLPPGSICTETYLVIGPYETQTEAEQLTRYLALKLPRYLVGVTGLTQDFKAARFRFVPDIGTEREWTDEALYERYDLTAADREAIENTIRPRPGS